MIKVEALKFAYPEAAELTLKDLSFQISEGEIFGFLGPSGSGKSTTQKILMCLLKDYQGQIQVMDKELRDWDNSYYEQVGVSFELPNHYLKLTARENLNYFRSLYTSKALPPETVLEWVDLIDHADKKVSEFSKGMKIRLNLARALIHQPKILFLDEPTSGLDPVNARKIKDLILSRRAQGTTVFVTTHDMMVADELCDRVGFLTNGIIETVDTPQALKKRYGKRELSVEYINRSAQLETACFPLDNLGQNQAFLALLNSGQTLETLHSQETTLEKIFIEVTGEVLRA